MEALNDVRNELETKRQELRRELESARGRIASIESDLKRVDEALGALTKPKRKKRSSKKPALTLDHVRRHLSHVRVEHPFADGHELKQAVREAVKAAGTTMTGFDNFFAQALAEAGGPSHGPSPFDAQDFQHHDHRDGI